MQATLYGLTLSSDRMPEMRVLAYESPQENEIETWAVRASAAQCEGPTTVDYIGFIVVTRNSAFCIPAK